MALVFLHRILINYHTFSRIYNRLNRKKGVGFYKGKDKKVESWKNR